MARRYASWLNSNKGTKCDMGSGVIPFIDWVFGLRSTSKIAPHLVHQFWEPNSHAVPQLFFRESYSPSRLKCRQAAAEPWATASRNACRSVVSLISSATRNSDDGRSSSYEHFPALGEESPELRPIRWSLGINYPGPELR